MSGNVLAGAPATSSGTTVTVPGMGQGSLVINPQQAETVWVTAAGGVGDPSAAVIGVWIYNDITDASSVASGPQVIGAGNHQAFHAALDKNNNYPSTFILYNNAGVAVTLSKS